MKYLAIFFGLLLSSTSWANIHFIDIHRITKDEKKLLVFNEIKEKSIYCDHFTFEWNYEITREDLHKTLSSAYELFLTHSPKNEENQLLLGTLAHYLYNLDYTDFHAKAVAHFKQAQKLKKSDYRAYWFLGVQYSNATLVQEGMHQYELAENFLPKPVSYEFWESYAYAAALAAMPSHTCYAMDQSKAITGRPGNFEQTLGEFTRGLFHPTPISSTIEAKELWKGEWRDSLVVTSRPLGIQLKVDTMWDVQPYPYENNGSALLLFPPKIKSPKGDSISYTIALIVNAGKPYHSLDEFADQFLKGEYAKTKKITLLKKYEKSLCFAVSDPSTYSHMGGARFYMCAVERDMPFYPGFELETTSNVKLKADSQLSFFTPSEVQNRMEGKIYYLILLDTCNDIHDESYAYFLHLLQKDLIIE